MLVQERQLFENYSLRQSDCALLVRGAQSHNSGEEVLTKAPGCLDGTGALPPLLEQGSRDWELERDRFPGVGYFQSLVLISSLQDRSKLLLSKASA